MKDYEDDEGYQEAMSELIWALDEGYEVARAKAIDNLITIRLALMIEAIEERIRPPSLVSRDKPPSEPS
jgi:hypothetical protein